MGNSTDKCPAKELIWDYVNEKLDFDKSQEFEKHLANCHSCIEETRKLSFAYDIYQCTKAYPQHGRFFRGRHYDAVLFPAAGSESENAISEVKSVDGKFIIRLIPFLDEDNSILEIQVLDKSIHGTLTLENDEEVIFSAPIIDGFVRKEIQNPIDLRQLFICID